MDRGSLKKGTEKKKVVDENEVIHDILTQAMNLEDHKALAWPNNIIYNEIAGRLVENEYVLGFVSDSNFASVTGIRQKGCKYLKSQEPVGLIKSGIKKMLKWIFLGGGWVLWILDREYIREWLLGFFK